MRKHICKLSVDALPWSPTGTPGVMEKVLNEDQATGARTVMLKSEPRPSDQIPDRRPQVHPVDEEFFCLSGRFTLEGDVWFQSGTYVYYPPNLVHGYAVDVPHGYEIYLRNSGSISTQRVETPAKNTLHFIDQDDSPDSHIIIHHTDDSLKAVNGESKLSVSVLRAASDDNEGAVLVNLPPHTPIASPEPGFDGFLEIFVISGRMELTGQATLSSRDYAFVPPGVPLELVGLDAVSCFIVNHSGQDILNRLSLAAPDELNFDH